MRLGILGLAGATLLFGAALASASDTPPAATDAGAAIAGRQAAFRMSGALFNGMKATVERGDDVTAQAFAARALNAWAKAIPGMFPAGSNVAPSEALPAVWSDRAGFEAKAANYAAAAAKLAELAKAGDKAGFAAQFAETGKACGACHDSYRKPQERH